MRLAGASRPEQAGFHEKRTVGLDGQSLLDLARCVVLQRADHRSSIGRGAHPFHPGSKREPQRPFGELDVRESGGPEQGLPFTCRAVANMRGISQQFHGLHVSVHQRLFVPKDVDDEQAAIRLKHAPHFPQGGPQPRPVMRAVASASQAEAGIGKGQGLRAGAPGFYLREAARGGRLLDRGKHVRRWIECDHAREAGGERKAQVPGAAADVDCVAVRWGGVPHETHRVHQIGALGMHPAGQVGLSLRIELILNGLAVGALRAQASTNDQ